MDIIPELPDLPDREHVDRGRERLAFAIRSAGLFAHEQKCLLAVMDSLDAVHLAAYDADTAHLIDHMAGCLASLMHRWHQLLAEMGQVQ